MFAIETGKLEFEESFNGHYIKLKEVEQNIHATKFAVCYNDDGVFKLRVFDRENRNAKQIADTDFNFNDLLGIDNWTMAINNFPDPFITCCFVTDEMLFVNLFHSHTFMHYHFYFNYV
jgi:hypothetical protein